MYLTRGVLNPTSRNVQRDLSDVTNLHRSLMKAFPDDVGPSPRRALGVLYRIDDDRRRGELVFFVQSREKPDFSRLPTDYFTSPADDLDVALSGEHANPRVRPVGEERAAISAGDRFVFRLRANTTKKILTKSLPNGTKQNGKRVPVRGDDARLAWFGRHAETAGFAVADVRVSEVASQNGARGAGRITFAGAQFDGVLVVRDAARFRAALEVGIGPGKAFGFGLLSLARV